MVKLAIVMSHVVMLMPSYVLALRILISWGIAMERPNAPAVKPIVSYIGFIIGDGLFL